MEACLASSLTAGGSTARATTTATSNPDPSDSVTLHSQPHACPVSAMHAQPAPCMPSQRMTSNAVHRALLKVPILHVYNMHWNKGFLMLISL